MYCEPEGCDRLEFLKKVKGEVTKVTRNPQYRVDKALLGGKKIVFICDICGQDAGSEKYMGQFEDQPADKPKGLLDTVLEQIPQKDPQLVNLATKHLVQCESCGRWTCRKNCFSFDKGLCIECARGT